MTDKNPMREALLACQRLFNEALPKFNWGASHLDANAIALLNEVPSQVGKALSDNTRVKLPDFNTVERFKCDAAVALHAQMSADYTLDSEENGFAQEIALQYGFDYLDDDATILAVRANDLHVFMRALGYKHSPDINTTETPTTLPPGLLTVEDAMRVYSQAWAACCPQDLRNEVAMRAVLMAERRGG